MSASGGRETTRKAAIDPKRLPAAETPLPDPSDRLTRCPRCFAVTLDPATGTCRARGCDYVRPPVRGPRWRPFVVPVAVPRPDPRPRRR